MRTYWIKFKDGSSGYCDGQSASDAVGIAERLSGKTADLINKYRAEDDDNVKTVPYPVKDMIWQFEHPVNGKCPPFCYKGVKCHGLTSCPSNPSCTS